MSDLRRLVFRGTKRPSDHADGKFDFCESCPKCRRVYRSESAYHLHVRKCSPVPEPFNSWLKLKRRP